MYNVRVGQAGCITTDSIFPSDMGFEQQNVG